MREKWKRMLTGGPGLLVQESDVAARIATINEAAESVWSSLVKTSNREYLWEDLAGTAGSHLITSAYNRIYIMALAYVIEGSPLEKDPGLKHDIIQALDWMYDNRYRDGTNRYSNWWQWQIGAPMALNDTTVLMYDDLTQDQIRNYMRAIDFFSANPLTGSFTAANQIWICLVLAVRSVILEDGEKLAEARDAISRVFPFVKEGDGFYTDGSFIQHGRFPYSGSYGRSMFLGLSKLLYLLSGTEWEVKDPLLKHLYTWIFEGFEPVMYKGSLMDMTRGRELSRYYSQETDSGKDMIESVLRTAKVAPKEHALRLQRMAKHWIQTGTNVNFAEFAKDPFKLDSPIELLVLIREVLNNDKIMPRDEYNVFKMFANMDRAVHHRAHFAIGISMFSDRVYTYESGSENVKGWYTAHGMTYLYNNDLGQFSNAFWPNVNPYRLPGTTVTTTPRADAYGARRLSSKSWVGGVELKRYGAVGMELEDYKDASDAEPMTAKKSWFLFDDEMVALGSDVHTDQPVAVETIVENRQLNERGDNALIVNGEVKPAENGWKDELIGAKWIHLAGNTTEADIGYYFPGMPTIHAVRETRSGKWADIDKGESSLMSDCEELTRSYLTLWFDHGVSPGQEKYAYVLMPGKTVAQLSEYADDPHVDIVEQSAEAHAVYHKRLHILGANFWEDAPKTVGPLTSYHKAAVLLKDSGGELDIAIADPTHKNQEMIVIEIEACASGLISVDRHIQVERLSPTIRLSVLVNGAMGRTFHAKFKQDSDCRF